MDCCGQRHAFAPRHRMCGTALISVNTILAGEVGPRSSTAAARAAETAAAALDVLRKSISVDVHTHGGKTGITSKAPPNNDLAIAMRAGSLAVACLADVPDGPVLGRNAQGVLAALRNPEPRQLYRHHLERLAWMDEMVANHGLRRALSAADLEATHKAGQPAIIADVEGLDFLETELERLEEAHQRGIRHVQLVHYTPNDIGDFQTGAMMHQGLTSFGAEVIRACHRLGFVCDVAHATEDMVSQAVKVATKPIILSHTALSGSRAMGPTPLIGRQISSDHARDRRDRRLGRHLAFLPEPRQIRRRPEGDGRYSRRRSRQHRHRPARHARERAGVSVSVPVPPKWGPIVREGNGRQR
jgi:membrane dipeptidase